jgi:hypothetical protein
LLSTSVQGQQNQREFNKTQFQGWGGLAVYCTMRPNDARSKGLCAWATQRLTLLARPLKIPVLSVEATSYERTVQKWSFEQQEKVSTLLDVELDFFATTAAAQTALFVGVRAGPFYSGAVEMKAPREQETKPRAGTLVMWDRSLIALGSGPDLEGSVRQNLETLLMTFLADFSDGR